MAHPTPWWLPLLAFAKRMVFLSTEPAVSVVGETDEKEIAARMAGGDEQAFDLLYDRYAKKVYAYVLRRVGDRHVAEDLTSDIFMKAFAARRTFTWRTSFSAWVYRIAANRVVDHYRAKKNDQPLDEEAENKAMVRFEGDVTFDRDALRRLLETLLDKLSERERHAVTLRFYAERSFEEVAQALGCTQNNATVIVHRALKKCQKLAPESLSSFF